jgi:hypothetical protein
VAKIPQVCFYVFFPSHTYYTLCLLTSSYLCPGGIGRWDCVVTCFFIDTAKNVVQYLDIIRNVLTPNGIWINLGALTPGTGASTTVPPRP